MSCHCNLCAHKADNAAKMPKRSAAQKTRQIPIQIVILLITSSVLVSYVGSCHGNHIGDVQTNHHSSWPHNKEPHHHKNPSHLPHHGGVGSGHHSKDDEVSNKSSFYPEKPIKIPSTVHFRHEKKKNRHHHHQSNADPHRTTASNSNKSDESESITPSSATNQSAVETGYNDKVLEAIQAFRSKIEPSAQRHASKVSDLGENSVRTRLFPNTRVAKDAAIKSGPMVYINPFTRVHSTGHNNKSTSPVTKDWSGQKRAQESTEGITRQTPEEASPSIYPNKQPRDHKAAKQNNNAKSRGTGADINLVARNDISEQNNNNIEDALEEEEDDYYDDDIAGDDNDEDEEDEEEVDDRDQFEDGDNSLAINAAGSITGHKKGGPEGLRQHRNGATTTHSSSAHHNNRLQKKMLKYPTTTTTTRRPTVITTVSPATTVRPPMHSYPRSRSLTPPHLHPHRNNRHHQSQQNLRPVKSSEQLPLAKSHNSLLRHQGISQQKGPQQMPLDKSLGHKNNHHDHINGELHHRTVLQNSDEYTDDELQADDYQSSVPGERDRDREMRHHQSATTQRTQHYRHTSGGGSGGSANQGLSHQQGHQNHHLQRTHHQQQQQHQNRNRQHITSQSTVSKGWIKWCTTS